MESVDKTFTPRETTIMGNFGVALLQPKTGTVYMQNLISHDIARGVIEKMLAEGKPRTDKILGDLQMMRLVFYAARKMRYTVAEENEEKTAGTVDLADVKAACEEEPFKWEADWFARSQPVDMKEKEAAVLRENICKHTINQVLPFADNNNRCEAWTHSLDSELGMSNPTVLGKEERESLQYASTDIPCKWNTEKNSLYSNVTLLRNNENPIMPFLNEC